MTIEPFLIFQKFNNQNSTIELSKLLEENKIEYLIENLSINFDPILPNNEFGKEFCIKLKKNDFERVDKIISDKIKKEIENIEPNYYLLNFTNVELLDVVYKSDEWNIFDVELAKKLLKERGNEISNKDYLKIKNNRINELSQPEKSQNIYIIIGYICCILGGWLGLFIGWHLSTYKKTLPNGNKIFVYSEKDRKNGNRIFKLGIIFIVFWVIFQIFK
jgi:hypothetical protein